MAFHYIILFLVPILSTLASVPLTSLPLLRAFVICFRAIDKLCGSSVTLVRKACGVMGAWSSKINHADNLVSALAPNTCRLLAAIDGTMKSRLAMGLHCISLKWLHRQ